MSDTISNTQNAIHQLDALLINQIAAGEVVTRPSAVVKELIENSLDASSSNIVVKLRHGGIHTIQVEDDGHGIKKNDLALAITQHATSKIKNLNDLHNISSLGFRGEALASAAAVARLEITSAIAGAQQAWQISCANGTTTDDMPIARSIGTTVTVRDLFFNTPARRKFLRTERTEFHYCENIVKQAALYNFDVSFSLYHNDKLIYLLPQALTAEQQQQRIAKLCSNEFIKNCLHVDAEHGDYKLHGYSCLPTFSSSKTDLQFAFVNGRIVKDKVINQAVRSAYSDVLYRKRHPAFVLYLSLPNSEVDVNVHPTKTEVRFTNSNLVYNYISKSIEQLLQTVRPSDQLTSLPINKPVQNSDNAAKASYSSNNTSNFHKPINNRNTTQISDSAPSKLSNAANKQRQKNISTTKNTVSTAYKIKQQLPAAQSFFELSPAEKAINKPIANTEKVKTSSAKPKIEQSTENSIAATQTSTPLQTHITPSLEKRLPSKLSNQDIREIAKTSEIPPLGYAICQLHNTYIVAENQQGLVIVETHAAHERIVYEQMKQQFYSQSIESQKLLLPINISLDEQELEFLQSNPELLNSMGFSYISGRSGINITAVPTLIKNADLEVLISSTISKCMEYGDANNIQEHINVILGNMACKQAIKSNNQLNLEQMNAILRQVETTQYSSQCNHGRPTWIMQDRKAIDKLFLHGT